MFDDLAAYYHENVVSAYIDYLDISEDGTAGRSRDLRGALVAATALFHLREHLPKKGRPTRSDIEKGCPDFAVLGDVVNAAKHKSITKQTPHGAPFVAETTQIGEQIVITEYQDGSGTYRYTEKIVIVKLSDGSERNLIDILTNVINYWELHLYSIGILSSARTFTHSSDAHLRSRAECEANRLDFELIQGQRFHQSFRLRRFNYQSGKIEPMDLSGSQLKFQMYRPGLDLVLSLTHNASGVEYKRTVTLTEGESQAVSRLTTDKERQAYIDSLPSVQQAIQQLSADAGIAKRGPAK